MATHDVVLTGLGIVSPFGWDVEAYYDALAACEVALEPTPWMPPDSGSWFASVKGFEPQQWMSQRVAEGSDRFAQFALAGVRQALADAGLDELDPLRTAVVLGTSMGGTRALERAQHLLATEGPDAVPRKLQIQVWPNMAAAQIAMEYGLHGPYLTVTTACAGSIDAIGTATRFLQSGLADVAITGASEGTGDIDFPSALFVNQSAYGMSTPTDDPRQACRPFDRDRTGIAGCEGAGIVVLETREHAERRGARIQAAIRGYANLADAHHPSSPDPSGEWEALVMRRALEDAGIESSSITGVYAHGTGTPKGDLAEIRAINAVHGARGRDLLVTSLKGHMGHPGSSAAAMNLVAGVVGMRRGEVLPTASTEHVDPACGFEVVLERPRRAEIEALQFNAFGFGGQNASLVVTPG
jgi:3-oxoacyl-[acyl-carrier-protein] synthase II